MSNILIIMTNHPTLGNTDQANGTFAPELTHAIHHFDEAGMRYQFASLKGGAVPVYGMDQEDGVNEVILAKEAVKAGLSATIKLADLDIESFDAVFYPGGFGLLSDLAESAENGAVTARLYEKGGIVGAVCHGPAGLLPVTLSDGSPLLAGKKVTCFTREEEIDYKTIDDIPFLLEETVARKAGTYTKTQPWGENVEVDGRIVTGQNPASASKVGAEMVRLLG